MEYEIKFNIQAEIPEDVKNKDQARDCIQSWVKREIIDMLQKGNLYREGTFELDYDIPFKISSEYKVIEE